MEIKSGFYGKRHLLISLGAFTISLMFVIFADISKVSLMLSIIMFISDVARRGTHSVAIKETGITIITDRFFIKRTICRPIDNISLEIIYSGSTGTPKDAILNVFEGTKCIYQVYAHHGFKEEEFTELILSFNDIKVANIEVGGSLSQI